METHEVFTRQQYQEAAQAIRERTRRHPRVALILGSGLNQLADELADADRIPYAEIPYFPQPAVAGHVGKLVIGTLGGQEVLILQGRFHPYEGVSPQRATFPVRVMHELGIGALLLTNAAGGLNPTFRPGDLMLINDHLGLAAMAGANPLWGPNDETLGPRFVNMSDAYDGAYRRLAREIATQLGIELRQGVYVGLGGPTFESPAEVRFLRMIGGDAVGMSTVPEVIVARHVGMRVLGISGISNVALDSIDTQRQTNHEEVLATGREMAPRLMALLRGILERLTV
jgi:purine-nucleoside phosphorylase